MKSVLVALSAGAALLLTACGGSPTGTNPSTGGAGVPAPPRASLTGAGATFPKPFYDAANFAKIKKWNDPAMAADNSGVSLPNQDIHVIHRSDGSGTTYIFTDYLCSVSADWKAKTGGPGKSITWPTGDGAQGNAGVATRITQTPGAIGYVELAYVLQTKMKQAALKNRDGNFVSPSAAGATAAAKAYVGSSPSQFSIVNASGKDSAPISGYSWIILYKDQADKTKGTALVDYLYWLTTAEGQQYAVNLHYAALPSSMASYDLLVLKGVTSGGSALLSVS